MDIVHSSTLAVPGNVVKVRGRSRARTVVDVNAANGTLRGRGRLEAARVWLGWAGPGPDWHLLNVEGRRVGEGVLGGGCDEEF